MLPHAHQRNVSLHLAERIVRAAGIAASMAQHTCCQRTYKNYHNTFKCQRKISSRNTPTRFCSLTLLDGDLSKEKMENRTDHASFMTKKKDAPSMMSSPFTAKWELASQLAARSSSGLDFTTTYGRMMKRACKNMKNTSSTSRHSKMEIAKRGRITAQPSKKHQNMIKKLIKKQKPL